MAPDHRDELPRDALSGDDWRLLIENVRDYAIFMLSPSGHVLTWNRGAAEIKGYQAEEIVGRHFSAFYPPEDISARKPEQELEQARRFGRVEDEGFRLRKDGSKFWASVVITALLGARGELRGFTKVTRDLTARIAAEQTSRELVREQAARAAAQLAEARIRESEERHRVLSHRLEVILEGMAHGVMVQDRSAQVIFANSAAAKVCGFPSVQAFLAEPIERLLARLDVLDEDGAPIDPRMFPGRRVLAGEPSASLAMHVRERATGRDWWSLVRATGVAGADGLPELVINIWHDISDERRREQHEKYLVRATAALYQSLDYASTLTTFAGLLVPGIADWCTIHLLEGDELASVVVAHADPQKVHFARKVSKKYPPARDRERGVWNVVRTGAPELYPDISDDLLALSAQDDEHLAILREVGMKSVLLVPIRSRERVLGVISLISAESGRHFDQQDLTLAQELGRRASNAIENARLYAAERHARDRLTLLARAGAAFAGAADYEEMLTEVIQIALPTLGDFGFFDVVEGEGVRRFSAAHEDPEVRALLSDSRWVRSLRRDKNLCALSSGETGFHPSIDDAWRVDVATSAEHLVLLRRLRLGSMMTVPLRSREQVLGALTVCFGASERHHTLDDLGLAEELARRAATAIVQVRLYAKAQEAARRAEAANRIKDEFLATVSHELRTPLNAILGWSSLLRSEESTAQKGLEVIYRNAIAQGKIIEDILDVSRIITGNLKLELERTDLVAIVRDAVDVTRPSAEGKRITLELVSSEPTCVLIADAARLQQVVWNLLSNAVKFTGPGGCVRVVVSRERSVLTLTVTDTGSGIDPEFLPFVFDRFRQADSSSTRRVGGLGLGLAIVRHLVELHGGTVAATSRGNQAGATFTVTLPVRAVEQPSAQPDTPFDDRAARTSVASANDLSAARILVVDDDPDAREMLRVVLTRAGATVESASGAAEALLLLNTFAPHVLVSDIGMPDEDGYSLVRRVRALGPEHGGAVPALALTAYARGEDHKKALDAGFSAHLAKPAKAADLVSAISRLLTPDAAS